MLRTTLRTATLRPLQQTIRLSSTTSSSEPSQAKPESTEQKKSQDSEKPAPKKKTMAELDEELRQKMSGLAGDGGEAGVELEGGQVCLIDHFECLPWDCLTNFLISQPVSMKRSVRENMFRYI
jgi:hypothetical protein